MTKDPNVQSLLIGMAERMYNNALGSILMKNGTDTPSSMVCAYSRAITEQGINDVLSIVDKYTNRGTGNPT